MKEETIGNWRPTIYSRVEGIPQETAKRLDILFHWRSHGFWATAKQHFCRRDKRMELLITLESASLEQGSSLILLIKNRPRHTFGFMYLESDTFIFVSNGHIFFLKLANMFLLLNRFTKAFQIACRLQKRNTNIQCWNWYKSHGVMHWRNL